MSIKLDDKAPKVRFNIKYFNEIIKIIWQYQRPLIFTMFIKVIIGTVVNFPMIIFPKFIIDELINGTNFPKLIVYIALMVIVSFALNTISAFVDNMEQHMRSILNLKLSNIVQQKSLEIDYSLFLETKTQEAMWAACKVADNDNFSSMLNSITGFATGLFTFIAVITLVSKIDISLLLISSVMICIQSIVTSFRTKKDIEFNKEGNPYWRRFNYLSWVANRSQYRKDLTIYDSQNFVVKKMDNFLTFISGFMKKRRNMAIKSDLLNNCNSTGFQFLSYLLLGIKVFNRIITIGDFTMYMTALNSFVSACNSMVGNVININNRTEYFQTFKEFMKIEGEFRKNGIKISKEDTKNLAIEFENVSFKYSGQDVYTLNNVNIKIKANERLAIVGENGAGKSTFVKLMSGLYQPTEGRILLNGIDIKEIDYNDYIKLFSAVFQDFQFFSFSVMENITFEEDAYETNLAKAEKLMIDNGLGKRLQTLKKGLNTQITKDFDSDGEELSGGEMQKLAIIRALYKDSPIIILDEPTAALDPNAEYEIYKKFSDMTFDKTAVYISHRIASTRFCDNIAVFDEGKIVEYGVFKDLLSKNGKYAEMYNKQAQYFDENININENGA
ncbi:MAG: ABC transporter ATP-binding protein/permease [Oscillospiraceae bacterium]|nr:ABC transporter ATP-binding protein/permease [Oscillospiraceae bacterium]